MTSSREARARAEAASPGDEDVLDHDDRGIHDEAEINGATDSRWPIRPDDHEPDAKDSATGSSCQR